MTQAAFKRIAKMVLTAAVKDGRLDPKTGEYREEQIPGMDQAAWDRLWQRFLADTGDAEESMTVQDLLDALKDVPPDTKVLLDRYEYGYRAPEAGVEEAVYIRNIGFVESDPQSRKKGPTQTVFMIR